ncbi:MAG TPA: alpha/beta hydrolase [Pyrinomonadaceae bacterium]|nr:alpha/beta hydrolase [Pyrinomonadaceae bacterium]
MTGNGRQIVYFLHGLLATAHHHFGPQLRAWKDELTVVPLDLPGHGRCPIDAKQRYTATAVSYTIAIMNRFGPGHVIAASYLGGPVAVQSALQRPDLVRSLVLTGFVPDVPREIFALWLDGFSRLATEKPELTQWYEETHGSRWPETLAAYNDDVRERYDEGVSVTTQMLNKLQSPVLIANGVEKSNERAAATDTARFGPRVRGQVIENAGHIPGTDNPDEFNRIVRAFWEETANDGCATAE